MPRLDLLQRNLVLLYGAEVGAKLLGITVFGYLGRILTQARYGDLEFAIGILFLLNLLMEAGLAPYGAREAAKAPARTVALAAQILLLRTALLVVAGFVLAGAYWGLDRDPIGRGLIAAYGLVLLPVPFLLNWAFQARDEMGVVAGSNFLRQVILAGLVVTWVAKPDDVLWVPVADALALASVALLQQLLFHRRAGALRPWKHLSGLASAARESAPMAASSVLWAVRIYCPLIALGLFGAAADTGLFGAGHRLVVAMHTFVWLYFFNLLPSLSRVARRDDLVPFQRLVQASTSLVAWVVLAGASIGTALAPWLVRLIYGENLAPADGPFAVMLWMLVAAFIAGHHHFSLVAFERQGREMIGAAVGAAVAVSSCGVLRDQLTPERAAMVFVASEVAALGSSAWLLRLEVGNLGLVPVIMRPLVPTVAAAALLANSDLSPLLGAATAGACFGVALLILGRDLPSQLRSLRVTASGPAPATESP